MKAVTESKSLFRSSGLATLAQESWRTGSAPDGALGRLFGEIDGVIEALPAEQREAGLVAFGSRRRFLDIVGHYWLLESLRELLERGTQDIRDGVNSDLPLLDLWGRAVAIRGLIERCLRPRREGTELRADVEVLATLLNELVVRSLTVALHLESPLARLALWDRLLGYSRIDVEAHAQQALN